MLARLFRLGPRLAQATILVNPDMALLAAARS